jgi:uncharacterized protein with HEPN domain
VPSKDPIQRFEDILENILIEEFTRGVDLKSFLEDLKTRNATERCLEGSVKPQESWETWPTTCVRMFHGPMCAHWGTSYATKYDRVDAARVRLMIEDDLGPLKGAAQRALERLRKTEQ